MSATLHVDDLTVLRAGRPVLTGVSLDIPPGEITTLLGPNGAGKSSLVLAIGGAIPVASGTAKLGDVDLTGAKPEKVRSHGVAVVPEGRRLLPNLTVEDNLRVATYNLASSESEASIADALALFPELDKRWHLTARSLSGGEQQMVVLAQALASKPKVMLVDELSLGLAPLIVKRLVPVLEQAANNGVGVLLIEQFAHIALSVAKGAYVIEGGRITYSGTAQELRDTPDLVKAAYRLGSANKETT